MSRSNVRITPQKFAIASLFLASLLQGSSVSAAPILDQQYLATGAGSLIVEAPQSVTQTFTVGMEGLLSSVDVQLAGRNPASTAGITLSIVDAPGGVPNYSAILATALIDPIEFSTGYMFVPVDLSAAMLSVTIGQRLGIYISTAATNTGGGINPYAWFGDLSGLYSGGSSYVRSSVTTRDMAFQTFVDSAVRAVSVPEPASLTMLGGGLLILARWSRRRRRSDLSASRTERGSGLL